MHRIEAQRLNAAAGGPLVRGSSESVDDSGGHSLAGAWQ